MNKSIYRKLDWPLIISYIILIVFGWLNIYAALHTESDKVFDFSTRYGMHLIWMGTSLIIAALILFVFPAKLYNVFAWWFYVIVTLSLFAVIFIGTEINGSHSWFAIGPFRFQPVEFSKISTSLALAALMGKYGYKFKYLKDITRAFLTIGIPMLLIVLEKETGSALVYVGFLLVFYREGMSGWVLILGILTIIIFIITLVISPYVSISVLLALIIITLGILSKKKFFYALIFVAVMTALHYFPHLLEMPNIASKNPFSAEIWITIFSVPIAIFFLIRSIIKKTTYFRNTLLCFLCGVGLIFSVEFLFENILKDYQRARIENLLGIKEDLQGVGYNVHQSKIAIGSGGLLGKGYLNGTQTRFNFVPEQSTDFIFCTIGEEWGFIGSVAILMLYMFILIRILKLAEKSKDDFVRIYGYCVVSCILMHILINVCMTIGLMPVIGIPLPFLSYGGSSLWAFTILLFIFIRLDLERWR